MEDEHEPTWDEAVVALETAPPVEVARPRREVMVVYRFADRAFTATSPDVTDLRIVAPSLHETRGMVKQDLGRFLDPSVAIKELTAIDRP